jgi:anti-sigma regulatory factor (Ser/Thr protein kinase)
MDISELIDSALSRVEPGRVEIATLEPAGVSNEVVGGLTQVVSELVRNAIAFSGPGQTVTINGVFDADGYLITISDDGVGISENLLVALNRVLEHPSPASDTPGTTMGITTTARVAARHGIMVRLVPGVPGTPARTIVPPRLVTRAGSPRPIRAAEEPGPVTAPTEIFATEATMVDLSRYERDLHPEVGREMIGVGLPPLAPPHEMMERASPTLDAPGMSDEQRHLAEEFLERVFAPLRGKGMVGRDRPTPRPSNEGNGHLREPTEARPPLDRAPRAGVTALRVRVPGANFSLVEDDASVASSEGAIDIRSALSKYELGRRNAATSGE